MVKYFIFTLVFIFFFGCSEEYKENMPSGINEIKLPVKTKRMPDSNRMVIKKFYFDIEAENFPAAFEKVSFIVNASKGYITDTDMRKGYNEVKSGSINALIPSDKLDTALNKIRKDIGEVKSESLYSEDVTENYIDVQARLENKRKAEEQYQLLMKKAVTVDEMLKIEQALYEVRTEIESAESKIKYYETQTSMTAVRINLSEPSAGGAPELLSFLNTIRNSIKHGINGLILVTGAIIIFLISVIPLIPAAFFLWKYLRKKIRKYKSDKISQT